MCYEMLSSLCSCGRDLGSLQLVKQFSLLWSDQIRCKPFIADSANPNQTENIVVYDSCVAWEGIGGLSLAVTLFSLSLLNKQYFIWKCKIEKCARQPSFHAGQTYSSTVCPSHALRHLPLETLLALYMIMTANEKYHVYLWGSKM